MIVSSSTEQADRQIRAVWQVAREQREAYDAQCVFRLASPAVGRVRVKPDESRISVAAG